MAWGRTVRRTNVSMQARVKLKFPPRQLYLALAPSHLKIPPDHRSERQVSIVFDGGDSYDVRSRQTIQSVKAIATIKVLSLDAGVFVSLELRSKLLRYRPTLEINSSLSRLIELRCERGNRP